MIKKQKSIFFFINLFFVSFYLNLFLCICLVTVLNGYSFEYVYGSAVNSTLRFSLYGGIFVVYFFSWLYTKCFYRLNNWLKSKVIYYWTRVSLIIFILASIFAFPFLLTQGESISGLKIIYFIGFFIAPGYTIAYFLYKYGMKHS